VIGLLDVKLVSGLRQLSAGKEGLARSFCKMLIQRECLTNMGQISRVPAVLDGSRDSGVSFNVISDLICLCFYGMPRLNIVCPA